jgi:hypothetical protein
LSVEEKLVLGPDKPIALVPLSADELARQKRVEAQTAASFGIFVRRDNAVPGVSDKRKLEIATKLLWREMAARDVLTRLQVSEAWGTRGWIRIGSEEQWTPSLPGKIMQM